MIKFKKMTLSAVLASLSLLAVASASASVATASIPVTGTIVAACSVTSPAVNLGNVVTTNSLPMIMVATSADITCAQAWSLSTDAQYFPVSITALPSNTYNDVAVSKNTGTGTFTGNIFIAPITGAATGNTTPQNVPLVLQFRDSRYAMGMSGSGAFTANIHLVITY